MRITQLAPSGGILHYYAVMMVLCWFYYGVVIVLLWCYCGVTVVLYLVGMVGIALVSIALG